MKKIHIIAVLMMLISAVILITASGDVSSYSTFEVARNTGERVKIAGVFAKNKSMEYNPEKDPNWFSFHLTDTDNVTEKVILLQPKPQDFERSEQVILTGSYENGIFVADEVLTKCPSKYKDEEIALRKKSDNTNRQ